MAQLRLAVVLGEVLGEVDVFFLRRGVAGVAARFVEGADREGAVHDQGLLVFAAVEHDPAAEAADRRHSRLGQHPVAPNVHNPLGDLGLVAGKAQGLAEVEAAAAAGGDQRQNGEQSPAGIFSGY